MNSVVFILAGFFILVFAGLPIAFSFGLTSLLFLLAQASSSLTILPARTFASIDSFPLMAIPFFILSGDIMKEGGLSWRLINFVQLFVGRFKGGLGYVTIVASAFFGAISGSSAATVAAIGGIMIPEMVKRGYKPNYAVALSAASGFLGILIPPSIPLIVYGINAEVSVGALFLATIVPGLLMCLAFALVHRLVVHKYYSPPVAKTMEAGPAENHWQTGKEALPALIMPLIILGGIYSGIFTPTEAGAVAVAYGLLVATVLYRSVSWKTLVNISAGSAITSTVILFIIGLAGVFGWIMTVQQLPALVSESITNITSNPFIIILLLNVIYLILGTFLETITIIAITTPIFLPLIKEIGMDLVHFGIWMQVNLCVGLITPPMALNILMACRIGNTTIKEVIAPLIPFLIAAIIVLIVTAYFPTLSLSLPNWLLK